MVVVVVQQSREEEFARRGRDGLVAGGGGMEMEGSPGRKSHYAKRELGAALPVAWAGSLPKCHDQER